MIFKTCKQLDGKARTELMHGRQRLVLPLFRGSIQRLQTLNVQHFYVLLSQILLPDGVLLGRCSACFGPFRAVEVCQRTLNCKTKSSWNASSKRRTEGPWSETPSQRMSTPDRLVLNNCRLCSSAPQPASDGRGILAATGL